MAAAVRLFLRAANGGESTGAGATGPSVLVTLVAVCPPPDNDSSLKPPAVATTRRSAYRDSSRTRAATRARIQVEEGYAEIGYAEIRKVRL